MRFPCLLPSRRRTDLHRNLASDLLATLACIKRHNGARLRLSTLACLVDTSASAVGRCLCLSTSPCSRRPCLRSSSSTLARTNRNLTAPTSLRLFHSSLVVWDPIFGLIRKLALDLTCGSILCQRLLLLLRRTTRARTTLRRLLTARRCQLPATIRPTAARFCRQWSTLQVWCHNRCLRCPLPAMAIQLSLISRRLYQWLVDRARQISILCMSPLSQTMVLA